MNKMIMILSVPFFIAQGMDDGAPNKKEVKRRPSLPALKFSLFSSASSSSPHTTPAVSPRQLEREKNSPRTIENQQFLEKTKKFILKRQAELLKLIEHKIKTRERLVAISQNLEQELPALPDDSPYLIIEEASAVDSDTQQKDMVRKIISNQKYEDNYFQRLGIPKSKRMNSGDFGNLKNMGLFADYKDKISAGNKTLSLEQESFLCLLFRTFRDNYRSSTNAELRQGLLVSEKGKVNRGFHATLLLIKDKERCKNLLSQNKEESSLIITSKKFVHTRERSNSDVW